MRLTRAPAAGLAAAVITASLGGTALIGGCSDGGGGTDEPGYIDPGSDNEQDLDGDGIPDYPGYDNFEPQPPPD